MSVATLELPVGYQDRSGRVHRELSLRKMTGLEEEMLYDAELNPGELVSVLIAACTVQLGELSNVDRNLVARMQVADRNYALLELRRLSLGDRLTARYRCPLCNAELAVVEDLSQIPVRRLAEGEQPEDSVIELEDGYRDEQGRTHRRLVLGPPVGSDEEFVAGFSHRHPLRARDALVLRCIRSFGELSRAALDGSGVEILRSLTLGDRRRIASALDDATRGPDFRRRVECGQCSGEFEVLLDASGFFEAG